MIFYGKGQHEARGELGDSPFKVRPQGQENRVFVCVFACMYTCICMYFHIFVWKRQALTSW